QSNCRLIPRQGKRSAGAVILRKKNHTDCGVRGKKQQWSSVNLIHITNLFHFVDLGPAVGYSFKSDFPGNILESVSLQETNREGSCQEKLLIVSERNSGWDVSVKTSKGAKLVLPVSKCKNPLKSVSTWRKMPDIRGSKAGAEPVKDYNA
ncbi:hypothetical protein, partial [Candidatus Erwinia dacicola]|uniref:hypothetical protein n=1 Tax=Candidatus Erwinia dacicola TaxID=252393 RepID=UPI001C99F9EB